MRWMTRLRWLIGGGILAAFAIFAADAARRLPSIQVRHLQAEMQRLEQERKTLQRIIERLTARRRLADIFVRSQHLDTDGRVLQSVIDLQEYTREGAPLPLRTFAVPGDTPHFDALVIAFEDRYVGAADALRGHSIALLRRIYGETQAPSDGLWIDSPGDVPHVYRVHADPSPFEQTLWREFWHYAREPDAAARMGVRVAQGQAVYTRVREGDHWRLELQADGGLSLRRVVAEPDSDSRPPPTRPPTLGQQHAP